MLVETRLMRYLIQDVVKGDICLAIVDQQDSIILDLKSSVKEQKKRYDILHEKYNICEESLDECIKLDTANQRINLYLKADLRKYRRQRNVFAAFSAACLFALFKSTLIP